VGTPDTISAFLLSLAKLRSDAPLGVATLFI
jgi:hypothetical protein